MIANAPHYNSIFNVFDKESLTPILMRAAQQSPAEGSLVCVIHDMRESGVAGVFPALMPTCQKKIGAAQQSLFPA